MKGSNFCRTFVFNEYFMIQKVSMCKNCAVFHKSFMIHYSPNNYITTQQHQLTMYHTTENVVSHLSSKLRKNPKNLVQIAFNTSLDM